MWPEELGTLAGVAQLPEAPHDLDEVVARVLVVGPAGVRRTQVLAAVGAFRAAAGDPQLGELAVARHQHAALVLALGSELDGLVPDALAVARGHGGREEAVAEQQERRAGGNAHGPYRGGRAEPEEKRREEPRSPAAFYWQDSWRRWFRSGRRGRKRARWLAQLRAERGGEEHQQEHQQEPGARCRRSHFGFMEMLYEKNKPVSR